MKWITKIFEDSDIIVTSKVKPNFVDDVVKFLNYLEEKLNLKTTSKIFISSNNKIVGAYHSEKDVIEISERGVKKYAKKLQLSSYNAILMNVLVHEMHHSITKDSNENRIVNLTNETLKLIINIFSDDKK